MEETLFGITRRLWPGLAALGERERRIGAGQVLGVLYATPLALAGIVCGFNVLMRTASQVFFPIPLVLAAGWLRPPRRLAACRATRSRRSSVALSRSFASLVFGITPTDPVTYGGVALVLIAAAVGASLIPARRASRVSPMTALRIEG